MSDLENHLTHSSTFGDITVDFNIKPLKCGFPSIEENAYIKQGVGNLVILSARPGNGKTALACQLALNVSSYGKVLFFSLEMEKEELKRRLLAVCANVPIDKLGESVFKPKVTKAEEHLRTLKFHICDKQGMDIQEIISKIYDENTRERLDLVIVDYIGIIKYMGSKRHEDVGAAAELLKHKIADKLKIPVVVLAQMKRGFEDRYAKGKMEYEKAKQYKNSEANDRLLDIRPSLEDLGESKGLECAADVVMFLQRPYLLDREHPESLFKVFVAKNRKGTVGDFELDFSSSLTKFIDRGKGI